jgi:hypothetical protein
VQQVGTSIVVFAEGFSTPVLAITIIEPALLNVALLVTVCIFSPIAGASCGTESGTRHAVAAVVFAGAYVALFLAYTITRHPRAAAVGTVDHTVDPVLGAVKTATVHIAGTIANAVPEPRYGTARSTFFLDFYDTVAAIEIALACDVARQVTKAIPNPGHVASAAIAGPSAVPIIELAFFDVALRITHAVAQPVSLAPRAALGTVTVFLCGILVLRIETAVADVASIITEAVATPAGRAARRALAGKLRCVRCAIARIKVAGRVVTGRVAEEVAYPVVRATGRTRRFGCITIVIVETTSFHITGLITPIITNPLVGTSVAAL